jgi:hypothetical protein
MAWSIVSQDTRILGGLAWNDSLVVGPRPPRLTAIVPLQVGHPPTIGTQGHMPLELRPGRDGILVGGVNSSSSRSCLRSAR